MIPVTKPYLPDLGRYQKYVEEIFARGWLTNNGPLLQELETRLSETLGVKHVLCVSNGSLALQVAFKALGLRGSAVTSPFSFVATTSTLLWEGLTPIHADIDPHSLNLCPLQTQARLQDHTSALVPVHVFGAPCDVGAFETLAKARGLRVIYDASHAFGVRHGGPDGAERSVLAAGDFSTVSFHATKLFHTVEGGALITNNDELAEAARQLRNFGFAPQAETDGTVPILGLGSNAKLNELQAAMGLCILEDLDQILAERQDQGTYYARALGEYVDLQAWPEDATNNHAYAPILLRDEAQLQRVQGALNTQGIFPRRYFYPSLDTLPYLPGAEVMPVSRDIASRVLCLPIYPGLARSAQEAVVAAVQSAL